MAPKVKYGIRAHLRDSLGGGSVKGACKLGIVRELQTVVADMQSMRAKSKLHLRNSKKIRLLLQCSDAVGWAAGRASGL